MPESKRFFYGCLPLLSRAAALLGRFTREGGGGGGGEKWKEVTDKTKLLNN